MDVIEELVFHVLSRFLLLREFFPFTPCAPHTSPSVFLISIGHVALSYLRMYACSPGTLWGEHPSEQVESMFPSYRLSIATTPYSALRTKQESCLSHGSPTNPLVVPYCDEYRGRPTSIMTLAWADSHGSIRIFRAKDQLGYVPIRKRINGTIFVMLTNDLYLTSTYLNWYSFIGDNTYCAKTMKEWGRLKAPFSSFGGGPHMALSNFMSG